MPRTPRGSVNLAPDPVIDSTPLALDAAPLSALLAAITSEIAMLLRLTPNSDACSALSDIRNRLEEAIREGGSDALWSTAAEYAEQEGITTSAATYRARKGKVPSRKVAGRHQILRSQPQAA